MAQNMIQVSIPFDTLVETVGNLTLENKRRLWTLLNEQLALAEEELWEQDPAFRSEIEEARAAYRAGDYMTLEEYAARQKKSK